MVKNLKRTLALMLSIIMILSSTMTAFASDEGIVTSTEAETSAQIEETVAAEEEPSTEAPKAETATEAEQKEEAAPAQKAPEKPQAFDVELKDVAAYFGEDATFTIKTDGEVRSCQWQMSKDNGKRWSNLSKRQYGSSESLVIKADQKNNGRMFRCEVTFKNGAKALSDAARLKAEKAPTFPAVKFDSEKVDGVIVHVDAPEGAFPEGTTMDVAKVNLDAVQDVVDTTKDVDGKVVAAVDITFFDANGKEIEPLTAIKVEMASKEIAKVETPVVVHVDTKADEIEDADVKAEEIQKVTSLDDGVKFSADQFTVYAVVEPGSDDDEARVNVVFHKNDGSTVTYYVKNKDDAAQVEKIVTDPGVGTLVDGTLFRGWSMAKLKDKDGNVYADAGDYVGPDYTLDTEPMTIEDIRSYLVDLDIHEQDTLDIYPIIVKYFNVTYYGNDEGVSLGSDIVFILTSETQASYTVNKAFTANANAKFMGWRAIKGTFDNIVPAGTAQTVYENKQNITIKGDVEFKAYAPKGNWLIYNTNGKGGTYNAPEFYLTGERTKQAENAKPENMKRYGYTFGGWYTNPECTGDQYPFGEVLENENRNIYAKWIENETAPYTVLIWKQKLNSEGKAIDDYELVGSHPSEGRIGDNIPCDLVDDGAQDYARLTNPDGTKTGDALKYTGFCLKPNIDEVEIKVDGKSTLNIYYDRILYNVRFYVYRTPGTGNNQYSYGNNSYAGDNTWGIVSYHNSNNHPDLTAAGKAKYDGDLTRSEDINGYRGYYFTVSARYGEKIADQWPTYADIQGADNRSPVSFVMMNGTKLKPNPSNGGDGTVKGIVSYLDENILGLTNSTEGNFLIVRFNTYNTWTYHIMKEVLPDASGNYPAGSVYLARTGKYYLESEEDKVITRSSNTMPSKQNAPTLNGYDTVMLSDDVAYSDTYNAEVTNQNGVSGHTPELNYYYDLKKNHISYFDGNYVDGDGNRIQNNSGNILHESEEMPQGSIIPDKYKEYKPDLPAGEKGFVFEGWYFDKACTQKYTFTTMPLEGIMVYAKWRQIEYRVFLHPEAETSTTNPDLYWGSDEQEMNFRVAYGGKVSTPHGLWTEDKYEFVAWFTDDGQVFDGDLFELNEATVTEDYDKTAPENYTDEMDQWGNGATYNKDAQADRWWITKKLDLTAQWREKTPGAKGIDVYYNAVGFDVTKPDTTVDGKVNGNPEYKDPFQYLDSADAVATSAANPTDTDKYQFLYWVVQQYDEDSDSYVDVVDGGKRLTVSPGDDFTVYKKYCKTVVTEWRDKDGNVSPTEDETHNIINKATYSMYLRAEYGPKETPKDTHITWYANGGKNENAQEIETNIVNEPVTRTNINLQINEAIKIPTGTFTRKGYTFVGWAKHDEPAGAFNDETDEVDETKYTQDDTVKLWLELNEDGTTYQEYDKNGAKVTDHDAIEYVAADEVQPYEAIYAVWKADYFYIYHSSTGELEAVPMGDVKDDDTYDLTAKVEGDNLYGGWYDYCGGTTVEKVKATFEAAQEANNHHAAVEDAVPYNGTQLKNGTVRFWTKTDITNNEIGTAVKPEKDQVFYLKEVPTCYLQTHARWVYDWSKDNEIEQLYPMTVIDDSFYSDLGFYIISDKKSAMLSTNFSYQKRNDTEVKTVTPTELCGQRGYIGYVVADDYIKDILSGDVVIKPYWITIDGVPVTTPGYTFSCTGADVLTIDNIDYKPNAN